jgi:ubiquinone/menaquinone biosynthesis C-methylase UbiE
MDDADGSEPHSAAYFGPQRDFWWNEDFLELLRRRLGLEQAGSVLDVGSGVGHWTALVASTLAPGGQVVGVEPESRSLSEAVERARTLGLSDRVRFVEGVAESLPFEDSSFDLVTCQTVLIHVADVGQAIAEMCRVAKHGGLVLVAEPNNSAGLLVSTNLSAEQTVEEHLDRLGFYLTCERGKIALSEGDSSVGDLLPGLFADAGLTEIQTFLNDKAFMLVPPYRSGAEQALKAAILEAAEQQRWIWARRDARRFYLAGGGLESGFAECWERRLAELDREAEALRSNRLVSAGGGIQYAVCGRRAD